METEEWRNKIRLKMCVCFDYVPIEEALTKNYIDMISLNNPFNHKVPINLNGLNFY